MAHRPHHSTVLRLIQGGRNKTLPLHKLTAPVGHRQHQKIKPPMLHNELVKAIVKPDATILMSLQPGDCNLLHMTCGVSGEAGELLDAIKKHVFYRKPLDMENVIEELGDIEFYLEGLRQQL